MVRQSVFIVMVTLSCASCFVHPVSRARFPSRTKHDTFNRGRARTTAVNLIPGGAGVEGIDIDLIINTSNLGIATQSMPAEASSVLNADFVTLCSGGGASTVPLLLSASLPGPGNTYLSTGLFGIAATCILAGAGFLVFSVVSGKNGLAAFLGMEKSKNPFYQDTIAKITPKTPEVLNKIRFPDLDFVEVYNQPPPMNEFEDDVLDSGTNTAQDGNVMATAETLRQRLLEAVKAKDYDLASSLERELASFLRKNGLNFDGDGK